MEIITGEWLPGTTAGGSRNDLEKFATNPQYVLTLSQPGKKKFDNFLSKLIK